MNGQDVPVHVHPLDGYLISRWYNTTDGLKEITDYVTDLFNIVVSEVCVSDDLFKMIEWVNNRQKTPLKKVVAWIACPAENKIIYLVRDCATLSEIRILSKAPPNFRYSGNFRRIDCLDISYAQWVKHWLSGGCPRLKLFRAETGSVDILQVLDGLLHNAVFVEDRRNYTSPFGYRRTLTSGFDIRRADGVTATVCHQQTGELVIAVWPETTINDN